MVGLAKGARGKVDGVGLWHRAMCTNIDILVFQACWLFGFPNLFFEQDFAYTGAVDYRMDDNSTER